MRNLSFLLFSLVHFLSQAVEAGTLDHLVCGKEVQAALAKWEKPIQWVEDQKDEQGTVHMRSPTKDKNIHLTIVASRNYSEALRREDKTWALFRWESKDHCAPKMRLINLQEETSKDKFTGVDLEMLLDESQTSKTSGVIFVWSPSMNYSIKGVVEAENIAKNLGVDFLPLLDPNTDVKNATKVAQANHIPFVGLRLFEAEPLYQRNMLNHYPSFIVYSKGRISGPARLGYDAPDKFKGFVKKGAGL